MTTSAPPATGHRRPSVAPALGRRPAGRRPGRGRPRLRRLPARPRPLARLRQRRDGRAVRPPRPAVGRVRGAGGLQQPPHVLVPGAAGPGGDGAVRRRRHAGAAHPLRRPGRRRADLVRRPPARVGGRAGGGRGAGLQPHVRAPVPGRPGLQPADPVRHRRHHRGGRGPAGRRPATRPPGLGGAGGRARCTWWPRPSGWRPTSTCSPCWRPTSGSCSPGGSSTTVGGGGSCGRRAWPAAPTPAWPTSCSTPPPPTAASSGPACRGRWRRW